MYVFCLLENRRFLYRRQAMVKQIDKILLARSQINTHDAVDTRTNEPNIRDDVTKPEKSDAIKPLY
jgi:hypothetical protein